ncbi:hypothetical protein [Yoonia sp.]|uniref:hypothetical protein n=1 Tax=Yoonia sp. TaxID=2212373 RepID=UPI003F6AA0E4
MKSIFLGFCITVASAVAAQAGEFKAESSSDGNAAFILLALVAVVVATGSGMLATRNDNSLDIKSDDADDNAGF